MMFAAACGADNTDGITFTTIGQPALFDAKLDDGRWQAYTPKHVFEDNATYNVPTFISTIDAMFVCKKADGTFSATEIRTAEANDLTTACDVTVQREQLVVTTHGVMPQASVDVYDFTDFIDQADAQFSIQAPLPKVDVIVHDSTRLALQRSVDTRDGPNEVTIDMANAPLLRTGHYTFDPPESDETLDDVSLFSTIGGTTTQFFFVGAGSYKVPDSSLVTPDDVAIVELVAFSPNSGRVMSSTNPDPATTFAMQWLPRITGTIDLVATAATLDPFDFEYDSLGVNCEATSGSEYLSITRSYREIHPDDLAFDEDVPGWRWAISADNRRCSAAVNRTSDVNTFASTSFY